MQIITDRAADLSPEQLEGLNFTYMPLMLTLDGKTYRSGEDIEHRDFYALLADAEGMPTTSLPSPGEMAEIYREMAKKDPDILTIHVSSGLSGTFNAGMVAKDMVDGANITLIDSKTLSGAQGWQVEAAVRAMQAGWPLEKIKELVQQVSDATNTIFTLNEMRYLIHGGRISHIKGLLADALNIKPLIAVDKVKGIYEQVGRARTFRRAVGALVDQVAKTVAEGEKLRVQVMHALNPEGAELLRDGMANMFECEFLPSSPIAPVLGAHTGPSLVGMAYAPVKDFPAIP